MENTLTLAGQEYRSPLIMGSAQYPNFEVLLDALEASGTELVTVAMRRVSLDGSTGENLFQLLQENGFKVLPNTAGCYTAKEAVLTARLAGEALGTSLVKLEVIGDEATLYPDVEELLEAARTLIEDGFTVLPYCNDDLITCQKLENLGCAAVMPLGSPIGSGQGIQNAHNIRLIREKVNVPVIIDAGVGTASDVTIAFELGCDGVLLNTAVAKAKDPVKMAAAVRKACEAGQLAKQAGRIPRKPYATASSPTEGMIESQ